MQNSYVHNDGQWHLVNNTYAHNSGQWHLVKNAYVHHDGQWHLTKSLGSNLDQTYETPGDFTYQVPDGVYNVQLTYPTPYGMKTFGIPDVTPGQEIPITIGEYGTTSSVTVSSSTYVLPAFDVPVLSLVTAIDGWLNIEFSATSPTGAAATSSSDNVAAQAAASSAGAIYNIEFEGYQQSGSAQMSLTPVKTEYIINWPNARILEYKWGGRNNLRTAGSLTAKGNYFTFRFAQNDDPQRGFGSYTYIYNLQQILKLTVSPAGPGTVAGNSLIVTPSSFSSNAVVSTLFTQQFSASGGKAPYTWGTSAGSINSSGLWSYTPPVSGTLAVSITATDTDGVTGTITPTLNIAQSAGTDGGGSLSLSSAALPSGQVGVSGYSATITGSNGVSPYIWSMTNGNLPQGLTGTAGNTTYTITGTPQLLESQTFTIEITDQSGQAPVSRVYTISIAQNVPVVSTSSLPSGTVESSYSSTSLSATGGTSPYTYNITLGSLPPGLTMTSGGLISGTPTTDGTYNFSVAATDNGTPKQTSVAKQLSIAVAALPVTSESVTIFTGFISSPATTYPIPFTPTITYTKTGGGSGTLVWQLSNGINVYNGSQSITSGTPVSLSITATTGTNYTLTASVGSVSATPATGIPIG
jgi:hypothetical protein